MPRPVATDPADVLLDLDGLVALFRVTKGTLTEWGDKGMPRASHGRYSLLAVVHWRLAHLADLAAAQAAGGGLTKKREALIDEQIVAQKIENQARAGDLLPAAEVQTDMLGFAAVIATALEALPARAAPTLATMNDPAVIQTYLRREVRAVRQAAADGLMKYASDTIAPRYDAAMPRRGRPRRIDAALRNRGSAGDEGAAD